MQTRQIDYSQSITLYLDQSLGFNRHLLSLIKQWDKSHAIEIHIGKYKNSETKQLNDEGLQVIDKNGSSFQGPEAVPIILKHLPFGKLAAAFYILPGTMWVTKQLYSLKFLH